MRERGILEVRIIHGKGTGPYAGRCTPSLTVAEVASFGLALEDAGGWGATLVTLRSASRDRGQHS